MKDIPLVIGYKLEKALQLLGNTENIIIETTSTPYPDKIEERQGNDAIVVRQRNVDGRIMLTTAYFAKNTLHSDNFCEKRP